MRASKPARPSQNAATSAPRHWPVAIAMANSSDAPAHHMPSARPNQAPGATAGPQRIAAAQATPMAGAKSRPGAALPRWLRRAAPPARTPPAASALRSSQRWRAGFRSRASMAADTWGGVSDARSRSACGRSASAAFSHLGCRPRPLQLVPVAGSRYLAGTLRPLRDLALVCAGVVDLPPRSASVRPCSAIRDLICAMAPDRACATRLGNLLFERSFLRDQFGQIRHEYPRLSMPRGIYSAAGRSRVCASAITHAVEHLLNLDLVHADHRDGNRFRFELAHLLERRIGEIEARAPPATRCCHWRNRLARHRWPGIRETSRAASHILGVLGHARRRRY